MIQDSTGLFTKEICCVCGLEDYDIEKCNTPEVCTVESLPGEAAKEIELLRTLNAEMREALRPFADAWCVATHHPEVTRNLTMTQIGELAAYEVSAVHFRNAANTIAKTEGGTDD